MQTRTIATNIIYVAVVDDDESVRRSFSRLLRAAGFQPVTYASAEALLGDVKRPRFDCLVLDVQLEGMSGLELSSRLAAVKDPTPIIFITAHDDPELESRASAVGCAGYFRKTTSGDLVLDAIRRTTGISQRKDPPPRAPAGRRHFGRKPEPDSPGVGESTSN